MAFRQVVVIKGDLYEISSRNPAKNRGSGGFLHWGLFYPFSAGEAVS